jgi:hypothetical protein
MAYTSAISTFELRRVAAASYEGRAVRVCLATVASSGYTVESTTANWDSRELASTNGYARVTVGALAVGAYDGVDGRYEVGPIAGANQTIDATFTASGGSLTWDRVYVVIGTELQIAYLGTESPSVTLSSGQSITYRIQLAVDD